MNHVAVGRDVSRIRQPAAARNHPGATLRAILRYRQVENPVQPVQDIHTVVSSEYLVLFTPTICEDEQIVINGTVYDKHNTSGIEHLLSKEGCDSIVDIDLSFYPPAFNDLRPRLCHGDSILLFGILYHETNPAGSVLLPNGSVDGCDSIILISLIFDNKVAKN